ncbi:hypothetical protein RIF29_22041 [Crotalaria pallida]|uniref:Uncharacterized protein n=1 Tax=Crotalaria pallida TaxID=3830 RepID=A0AAN9I7Q2_CROPI
MMAENLFEWLPPPSSSSSSSNTQDQQPPPIIATTTESTAAPPPKPILKSSLKRPNPTPPNHTQGLGVRDLGIYLERDQGGFNFSLRIP